MGSQYNTTIGTLLVGIFFNTFLYGLVTYQFAAYHATRFHDAPITRYMVLFLFIVDTIHSTSLIYAAWNYTVMNYGNPAAAAGDEWPFVFTPLAIALAALVTQLYLGIRIWRLTCSRLLFGVVILLAIPSFTLGMMTSIMDWTNKANAPRFKIVPTVWLSTQAILDTFITITLTIIFGRSRTGFYRTDTILNRFIRAAIQTGFFADLFTLADLITRRFFPHTNLYVMFAIPLGRVYTNTLLDILLCRELLMNEAKLNGMGTQSVVADTAFIAPIDSQAIPTLCPTIVQLDV